MGLRGESKEEKEKIIMRTRTRKMLSLLLATAMVFTLNTSVWAVEIGDDEATVDAIVTEDPDAAEIAGVTEDLAADGWTMSVEKKVSHSFADPVYKDGKLLLSENQVTSLVGTTDSKPITLSINSLAFEVDEDGEYEALDLPDIKEGAFKVNAGDSSTGSLVVTINYGIVASDNGDILDYYGYDYLDSANSTATKEDMIEWAEEETCGTNVVVSVAGDFEKKQPITLTYTINTEGLKAANKPYGEKSVSEDGATFTYCENVPFSGTKIKSADAILKCLGISLSKNGTVYKVEKVTLKHKKGEKTVTLKITKITGSDKKVARSLKKSLNKRKITLNVYPLNLSTGGYDNVKTKTTSGKESFSAKVNGKKFKVKQGKSDKWGGTAKITLSGNKMTVSGSNIFTGTMK